jgi:hypothetical protein
LCCLAGSRRERTSSKHGIAPEACVVRMPAFGQAHLAGAGRVCAPPARRQLGGAVITGLACVAGHRAVAGPGRTWAGSRLAREEPNKSGRRQARPPAPARGFLGVAAASKKRGPMRPRQLCAPGPRRGLPSAEGAAGGAQPATGGRRGCQLRLFGAFVPGACVRKGCMEKAGGSAGVGSHRAAPAPASPGAPLSAAPPATARPASGPQRSVPRAVHCEQRAHGEGAASGAGRALGIRSTVPQRAPPEPLTQPRGCHAGADRAAVLAGHWPSASGAGGSMSQWHSAHAAGVREGGWQPTPLQHLPGRGRERLRCWKRRGPRRRPARALLHVGAYHLEWSSAEEQPAPQRRKKLGDEGGGARACVCGAVGRQSGRVHPLCV